MTAYRADSYIILFVNASTEKSDNFSYTFLITN